MQKYSERYIKYMEKMGESIKTIRIEKGYSVKLLAQKTKFSKNYISNLEKGRALGTTMGRIIKIANALDVNLSSIC